MKDQTYRMTYTCRNCYQHFFHEHPYGSKAVQPICLNCGVEPSKENKYDYSIRDHVVESWLFREDGSR